MGWQGEECITIHRRNACIIARLKLPELSEELTVRIYRGK